MELKRSEILNILSKEKIMYVGTTNGEFPDNSAVCFAYDEDINLFFGSYSDTLKCKYISINPYVAITVNTLQIHGVAKIISYGTEEYIDKREIYDKRFPMYKNIFEKIDNELYVISPLVTWNYNPSLGEMNRDELIFNMDYYNSISPYKFHEYIDR